MTEPLQISFEVACTVDDAFSTWTERIGTWWPADHTISGSLAEVIFEGRVGGRIYERTPQGEEHEWGVVTDWRPPKELGYRWHLGFGPESFTEVAVTFSQLDKDLSLIHI